MYKYSKSSFRETLLELENTSAVTQVVVESFQPSVQSSEVLLAQRGSAVALKKCPVKTQVMSL
jgi:hypothetical protein